MFVIRHKIAINAPINTQYRTTPHDCTHAISRGTIILPFLKKNIKQQSGVIVHNRAPDESPTSEPDDSGDHALEACAQDMIDAVHRRDAKAAASAMRAAFQCLESEPHEEDENNDFHSQNEKAAQGEQE